MHKPFIIANCSVLFQTNQVHEHNIPTNNAIMQQNTKKKPDHNSRYTKKILKRTLFPDVLKISFII